MVKTPGPQQKAIDVTESLSASPAQNSEALDFDVHHIEFGVTRSFGFSDLNRRGLSLGWAGPEEGHNWTDGHFACFRFVVNEPDEACMIEFSGEPFFNERLRRQDIIMHVNGFFVAYFRLTAPGPVVLSARVEPAQMFVSRGLAVIRCTWSFPDSVTPAALGISDDTRELGFCFRSITIDKAKTSSAHFARSEPASTGVR